MKLTLGIFGDLHAGLENWKYKRMLVCSMMDFFKSRQIDAVLDLGDRVEGHSRLEDLKLTLMIRQELTQFRTPIFHLHGNHDTVYVQKSVLNEVLEKQYGYENYMFNGFQLVLLDSTDPVPGYISKKQAEWLDSILNNSVNPTVLFSHHPVCAVDISSHPYFSVHRNEAMVENWKEIQTNILKTSHVLGVFQGHLHQVIEFNLSGVYFGVMPSLDTSVDANFPIGGVAIIELSLPANLNIAYFRIKEKEDTYDFIESSDCKAVKKII
jgi:Icc-related predicted phosphoesterase